ncbi:MAG: hypothetical protein PHR28_12195 [candidate division Zixibacteria bacterium]|nr:hypothetical protein [candidate division Zixibacteria bacterium]
MDFKGLIRLGGICFVAIAWLALSGCDSPNGPGIPGTGIEDIFPTNGATDQNLNVTLQWAYAGDTLKASPYYYDVFFGTQSRPPLIADSLYDNKFTPGSLDPQTVYFWRVQAYHDGVTVASSPVMHFKTGRSFTYPLAAGLRWDYWHEIYSYADEQHEQLYFRDTGRSIVEIVAPLIIYDTIDVYDLYIRESIGAERYTGHVYLNNTEDGLYTYDYTIITSVTPRPVVNQTGTTLTFAGHTFDSSAQLFAFLDAGIAFADKDDPYPPPDPPESTKSYAYPLKLGSQWTYRFVTSDGNPWRIDKKVIRREQITVPAGVFDCFVIRWFWDVNNDGQWDGGVEGYDYLAPQGLIKREFYAGKVGVTTYDHPDGTDYYDFYDGYTLTDYGREMGRGRQIAR